MTHSTATRVTTPTPLPSHHDAPCHTTHPVTSPSHPHTAPHTLSPHPHTAPHTLSHHPHTIAHSHCPQSQQVSSKTFVVVSFGNVLRETAILCPHAKQPVGPRQPQESGHKALHAPLTGTQQEVVGNVHGVATIWGRKEGGGSWSRIVLTQDFH